MKHKFHTLLLLIAVLFCTAATASNAQSYSDLTGKKWLDRTSAIKTLSDTREHYYAFIEGNAFSDKDAISMKLRLYAVHYAIERLGEDLPPLPDVIWEAYNQAKDEYGAQASVLGITASDHRFIFDEFVSIVGK